MSEARLPVYASAPLPGLLDRVWPHSGHADRAGMPATSLGLAALAGVTAGSALPDASPGLGLFVVGMLVAAATLPSTAGQDRLHRVAYGSLGALLLAVVLVHDAGWVVSLCLLATVAVSAYALSGGRTLTGVLLAGLSLPLAGLRALPWIGRGVRTRLPRGGTSWGPALRAAAASTALLLVFGALFASADAVFASLLPEADVGDLPVRLPVRILVFALFTGLAASAAYLAAVPPRWDVLAPSPARPVRPFEWIAPIAALLTLFAIFVGVQLTVLLGGDDYVRQTAGLTHAEHARSGFGQLVAVTLLTLAVVGAAARWAPRSSPSERRLLRVLLGTLCVLTLAVVVSALHRLHLYEEAFGFTRLRLFMNVFESWLGVLVALVLVAGVRLRASWLPRAVVATAAIALLSLAAVNPDGFIADRNVARFEATGKIDVSYLQQLSADAVPALDRLREPTRSCALHAIAVTEDDGIAGWNLGRDRARSLLADRPLSSSTACST